MNVTLYDDHELYMDGSFGKILDEPVGFTPLYILKNDFVMIYSVYSLKTRQTKENIR